jgi:hypothetical protein
VPFVLEKEKKGSKKGSMAHILKNKEHVVWNRLETG